MEEKTAIYAGMFDPLTVGHMWVIEEGAKLFDKLIVAVGVNPEKQALFTLEDRLTMLKGACSNFDSVEITYFENQFLVEYAKTAGAQFILRSVRTESDYEYERVLHHVNRDINPSVTTVFLMPPRGIAEVSSSMVKNLIGLEGWENAVKRYVPETVFQKLQEIHS